jgi:hypothetical protein
MLRDYDSLGTGASHSPRAYFCPDARFEPQRPELERVQLFWRAVGTPFTEENSAVVHVDSAEVEHKVRFSFPRLLEGFGGFRFDPATRPGFLHITELTVYDREERLVWRWDKKASVVDPDFTRDITILEGGPQPGLRIWMRGDDPYFGLIFDGLPLASLANGGVLEVQFSYPPLVPAIAMLHAELSTAEERRSAAEANLARTATELSGVLATRDQQTHELADRDRTIRELSRRMLELSRSSEEAQDLRLQISDLKGSLSWRLMAPLRFLGRLGLRSPKQ